jgi:Protein of unknown function (DUF3467)
MAKDIADIPLEILDREIPIEFVIPEGFGLLYSDTAFVQNTENEFVVSFFQGGHPPIKSREEAEKIEAVKAYCVARIVMSPVQVRKLTAALVENIERHEQAFAHKKSGDK